MGKKRVAVKTQEESLAESETVEKTAAEKASKGVIRKERHERGKVFIQASFNNTVMTATDMHGNVITWMSAGTLGFSGPKKATPFAASKVATALAEKVQKSGPITVEVYVKGVGAGRDSAVRSLATNGFNIISIKDVTPIPHNGPRPKKARRV